jgi:prepilin signal peptidase PulO-like enzyme (type II secretory pathway)
MIILVILLLIFLGLCFGSFVNAFVWRFHEQSELRDRRLELIAKKDKARRSTKKIDSELEKLDAELPKLSITRGRSMCVHCHHELAPRDLVPVLSYLMLRGKCRYCQKPIPDTPLAELATPLLFVMSYLLWPRGFHAAGIFQFIFWLVFLVGFVALMLYDLKWQELPHDIVFTLVGMAVAEIVVVATVFHGGMGVVLGAVYGALVISGLFCLLYLISPKFPEEEEVEVPEEDIDEYSWGSKVFLALFGWAVRGRISQWIGGGDIALGLLLGLLVGGAARGMLLIFLASLLGTFVAVPLMATGRATRSTHLPFGPFLILAAIITVLLGAHVISWYSGHLLGQY